MVKTTIVEQCDILMGFSIDNHNGFVRRLITVSFVNKYYECCDTNSDNGFLYNFHGFILWLK